MDYKELLEKLSQKMPNGWELAPLMSGHGNWHLKGASGGMMLRPALGDIGLAPLTALLKQSLPDVDLPERDDRGWWNLQGTLVYQTEFEVVAHAYLAMREKE